MDRSSISYHKLSKLYSASTLSMLSNVTLCCTRLDAAWLTNFAAADPLHVCTASGAAYVQ